MRLSVLLCLLLSAATVHAGTPLPDGPHVVVSAEGKVEAPPDQVRISLTVEATAETPAQAKATADAAVNGFLEVLRRHRVATSDVSASELRLAQSFDYGERGQRTPTGHAASRSVEARIRDVDGFNAIIDEGLAAGMTRIDSVNFESASAVGLRAEARRQAAAHSRERAEELARAYGARLGSIYSINSVGSAVASQYGAGLDRVTVTGAAAAAAPARYLQPTIAFSEKVNVVFRLDP
ncbi:MAG: SIMPL domain-containing protein [Pseudoxanthomonas suwonensis]|nr:SIMPL domain-containing protein [Pseudoxanthomonas suwonensis]